MKVIGNFLVHYICVLIVINYGLGIACDNFYSLHGIALVE